MKDRDDLVGWAGRETLHKNCFQFVRHSRYCLVKALHGFLQTNKFYTADTDLLKVVPVKYCSTLEIIFAYYNTTLSKKFLFFCYILPIIKKKLKRTLYKI